MNRLSENLREKIDECVNCMSAVDEAVFDKAVQKLAYYEDLEEVGRLVVLPCKVGDWVYALWSVPTAYKYVIYCAEVKEICHSVRNCRMTTTYLLEPIEYRGRRKEYRDDDFGKTVFLTREDAERALEETK